MAAFGLVREGGEDEDHGPLRVYPCNWLTLNVFCSCWNQWRIVMGKDGPVRMGMDWSQVESALTLSGIKRREWPVIFEGLQAMENEAITSLNSH